MLVMDFLDTGRWDRRATRKRVERLLEKVRMYQQVGPIRREVRITASPEPNESGPTHRLRQPTESVAVWNVEQEEKWKEELENVQSALARLDGQEREIIQRRYLARSRELDYLVCQELGLSERTYRRIKSEALAKLAWMLRLEVVRKDA